MAVGEPARRRKGRGAGEEQLDPLPRGRVVRDQPESAGKPPGRALGGAPGGRLSRLDEHRDCRGISGAGRLLHVMGARGGARTAGREGIRRAFVGAEAPGARRRHVDRSSHQGVPDAEAPRYVSGRTRSSRRSSSSASSTTASLTDAAAAASSGSNGSPTTAAPSSTRRTSGVSCASSAVKAAATRAGIPMSTRLASRPDRAGPASRVRARRAARGRTGCPRSPRTAS